MIAPVILAIDSSTGPCSAALWHNGGVVAYVENRKPVMQSASLLPMIEDVLRQSDVEYKDLTHVAATIGPGSFTGIRVGLATAQGIAFAAGIGAIGFTTLEVLAFAARSDNTLAILNAGKGEVYYQYFSGETLEAQLGTLEQVLTWAGDDIKIASNIETGRSILTFPRADALAELAANSMSSAKALRPFYIRAPDAKLPTPR